MNLILTWTLNLSEDGLTTWMVANVLLLCFPMVPIRSKCDFKSVVSNNLFCDLKNQNSHQNQITLWPHKNLTVAYKSKILSRTYTQTNKHWFIVVYYADMSHTISDCISVSLGQLKIPPQSATDLTSVITILD